MASALKTLFTAALCLTSAASLSTAAAQHDSEAAMPDSCIILSQPDAFPPIPAEETLSLRETVTAIGALWVIGPDGEKQEYMPASKYGIPFIELEIDTTSWRHGGGYAAEIASLQKERAALRLPKKRNPKKPTAAEREDAQLAAIIAQKDAARRTAYEAAPDYRVFRLCAGNMTAGRAYAPEQIGKIVKANGGFAYIPTPPEESAQIASTSMNMD